MHEFLDQDGDKSVIFADDAGLKWRAQIKSATSDILVSSLSFKRAVEGDLELVGRGGPTATFKLTAKIPLKGLEQHVFVKDLIKTAKSKNVQVESALPVLDESGADRGVVFWDKDGDMSQIFGKGSGLVWLAHEQLAIHKLEINFASDGNYEVTGTDSEKAWKAVICNPPPGVEQHRLVAKLVHEAQQLKVKLGGTAFEKMSKSSYSVPQRSAFKVGQEVIYLSVTADRWIDCQIQEVRPADGAVQISVKRGYWMSVTEQKSKLMAKEADGSDSPVADSPVAGDKDLKYDLDHRPGFFLAGDAGEWDGRVESAAEARSMILKQPDKYMGYTVSSDGTLAWVRAHGSELMPIPNFDTFLLSCKHLDFPGKLYEDKYCTNHSKFPGGLENGKPGSSFSAVWKRPGRGEGLYDIEAAAKGLKLFGQIDPCDIQQGHVGDCSLLAVISALGEFPGALKRLFRQQSLSKSGRYDIVLWDWGSRDWKHFRIDDRFATKDNESLYPLFAKMSEGGEIYPMLLEKAVAAMAGGFDFMSSIMPTWAMGVLTGSADVFEFHRDNSLWSGWHALYDGTSTWKYTPCYDGVWEDGKSGTEPRRDSTMWKFMEMWDQKEFVMSCGVRARGKDDSMTINGIFYQHAYSLIDVLSNIAGTDISLVKLRNPHGKGEADLEWKDGGPMWSRHPEVARACKHTEDKWKDDGLFWVSKSDFFKYFNVVYLVRCPLGKKLGEGAQGPPTFAPPTDSLLPTSAAMSRVFLDRKSGRETDAAAGYPDSAAAKLKPPTAASSLPPVTESAETEQAAWKWLLRRGEDAWASYSVEESEQIEATWQRFAHGDKRCKSMQLLVAGRYNMTITFNEDVSVGGGTQKSDKGLRRIKRDLVPVAVHEAIWEFQKGDGFTPFGDDCKFLIETCYQNFKKGKASSTNIKTGEQVVMLNFAAMTQQIMGESEVQKIRRRSTDS